MRADTSSEHRRPRRPRLSPAERDARNREALARVEQGESFANFPTIYAAFEARGIPTAEILPRVNVLTFNAWKAKGRHVRKGERGVRVVTVVITEDKTTGETKSRPSAAYVFHVSQTDETTEGARAMASAGNRRAQRSARALIEQEAADRAEMAEQLGARSPEGWSEAEGGSMTDDEWQARTADAAEYAEEIEATESREDATRADIEQHEANQHGAAQLEAGEGLLFT